MPAALKERGPNLSTARTKVDTMQSYTIAEFCALHRISRNHLNNLIRDGHGPTTIKMGRAVRITEAANAEWLAKLANEPAS
jgi:predicted DNA-binding transcriptional regulator AlpA